MKTHSLRGRMSLVLPLLAGCLATAMGQSGTTVTVQNMSGTVTYGPSTPIVVSIPVGSIASPVDLHITSVPSGQNVTLGLDAQSAQYIFVNYSSGQTPFNVTLASLPSSAPVFGQTINGALTISANGTQVGSIPIVLNLGSGSGGGGFGTLGLNPSSLEFAADNNALPLPQGVQVIGTVTGGPISATASCSGCTWLVPSVVGNIGDPFAQVLISVNTSGLPTTPQTYTGTVHITSMGQAADLPVTLKVNGGGSGTGGNGGTGGSGGTGGNTTTLAFTYDPNSPTNVASQTFSVTTTASLFSYTITKPSEVTWVDVVPNSGLIGTGQGLQATATHTVTVNANGLTAGTHETDFQVLGLGQTTPSQTIHVTLNVLGGGSGGGTGTLQTDAQGLLFNMTGTQTSASQQLVVTTTGSALNYGVAVSTPTCSQGGALPAITTPGSGTTGAPITITVTPSTLAESRLDCTATLTLTGGGSVLTVPLTIAQTTGPILNICTNTTPPVCPPQRIRLTATPNQTATAQIALTSSDPNTTMSFTAIAYGNTAGNAWLKLGTLQPGPAISANTPFTLQLNATSGAVGTYQGSIAISANNPNGALPSGTWSIPVTFTVANTPTAVTANPTSFSLSAANNVTTPITRDITLAAADNSSLPYTATVGYSLPGDANWLTITQGAGGTTAAGNKITISALPNGLTLGQHQATVFVTVQGGTPVNIPVTLNVTTPIATTSSNPATVTLSGNATTSTPATQTITLSASGGVIIPYTATVAYDNPAETWLSFTQGQVGSTAGANQMVISAMPTGLSAGQHKATINVQFTGGTPLSIPVTLNVTAPTVTVTASPSSVTLNAGFGSAVALTQQFTLNSGNASLAYSASINYNNPSEGNWLAFVQGQVGSTAPGNSIIVAAQPAGLSIGEHKATINVNVTNGTPVSIPVSLVVAPQLTLNVQTLTFTGQAGAVQNPASQTFTISSAAGTIPYSVQVNSTSCGGSWLTATPQSGTTTAGTPAVVTVGVNGLSSMQTGTCAGTITVSSSGFPPQTINVNLNVTAPPPPQITKIVNAASFLPGPIAAGEILAIGGSNLGPRTQQVFQLQNGMIPNNLAGVQVLFDGVAGSMLSISPVAGSDTLNQINVIAPYEIAGRAQVTIQVVRENTPSNAVIQQVVPTAPAVFFSNAVTGDIAMYDNTLKTYNSPSTPASIGDIVTMYGTGEGIVVPLPQTGSVTGTTLASIPHIAAPYAVRLGGVALAAKDVLYVGPAPGLAAGVFQVNFRVPEWITTTQVPVSIAIGTGGDQAPQGTGYMYVRP